MFEIRGGNKDRRFAKNDPLEIDPLSGRKNVSRQNTVGRIFIGIDLSVSFLLGIIWGIWD